MDATNGTPKRPSKGRRQLARLRLKKQLARERMELVRLERAANLEELRASNIVPRQRNPQRDLLIEALKHKANDQVSLLEQAKAQGKQLTEGNFLWDWVSGYQDLIDRLRSPDGLLLSAISIVADRMYGSYWPFFRTWNDLALLRGASRIAYQTGCLARGAINSVASYIIGDGFVYHCHVKKDEEAPGLATACQDILDQNAERNDWSRREFACPIRDSRDGEWYLRSFGREDGLSDWRWIEPEQLIQPGDSQLKEWSFGKQNPIDPYDVERTLAYNACYDGNNSYGDKVPANEVIGHTHNVDSTVKRGIPDLAYDCYDFLKTASRLIDNMATGAAVQASIAYVRQWEAPVTPDVAGDFVTTDADYSETNAWTGSTEYVRRHKAGSIEDVPKGMGFLEGPSSPGAPNWVAIEQSVLSAVAITWSAPKWLLSNDTDLNYASSLTAESPFVKRCQHIQNVRYKPLFLSAKWRELFNWCQAHDGITANGRRYSWADVKRLINIQCEPPSVEVRNKGDEAQANAVRVQSGWKSRQTVAAEEGLDWEQEQANIEQYNDEMGGAMGQLPMPGEDEERLDGNFGGGTVEQWLRESGFTGIDSHGHKWVNGKQVKRNEKAASTGEKGQAANQAHPGSEHGSSVKIKPSKQRAFQGQPVATQTTLTKQETGRVGEAVCLAFLRANGAADAKPMNNTKTNFPVDLIEDHAPTEIKAGLVSNTRKAQQWRLTFSKETKTEIALYEKMTPEERKAWNEKKQQRIKERKQAVIDALEKEHPGQEIKPRTMTVIINPDTRTADIYAFEGFHDRIDWQSAQAQAAYKGSVKYG